ncbi:hypothetical protein J4Q44_G00360680 [Coregonus suidteri]|uniref:Uncharacterized protein n=1 Tax=Coregonus suidteri TaxID=861788 RepID=A0AAN8KLQ9_9TELE
MATTMLPELQLLNVVKGNVDSVQRWVSVSEAACPIRTTHRDWKSLLSPNVINRNSEVHTFKPEAISTFTSDTALVSFADYFRKASESMK